MQIGIEGLVKLIVFALLIFAGLAIWLLPKTRLLRQHRISERAFVTTAVVGIGCGLVGLVITFAWPQRVLEWHLWELAAMPLVLVYAYWLMLARKARKQEILDEKQELDIAYAGQFTLGISIVAMGAAFVLNGAGLFDPALWYPFYLFVVLLVYSAATLFCFKRG